MKSAKKESVDSAIGHLLQRPPVAKDTLRLAAQAMACEFAVIMNAGERSAIWENSSDLDLLEGLEQQMSAYRSDSELVLMNDRAATESVPLSDRLYRVILRAVQFSMATDGAFDATSAPLIQLWRTCRDEKRLPNDDEVADARSRVGSHRVKLDEETCSVRFQQPGLSLNLGAIGKGFALDEVMAAIRTGETTDVLLHGGRSSLLASGTHHGCDGWPVGLGNPLLTNRRLGTIVLRNQAMSTSGSNSQYFRVRGDRYGHILDPRTGWPASGMLSVTVLAPTAAEADALSTAFYVMQPGQVATYCEAHSDVGAIIVPFPVVDRRVQPQVYGVDISQLYWDRDQVRADD